MARAVKAAPSANAEPKRELSWLYKTAIVVTVVAPFLATLYAIVLLWQQYVTWLDIGLMVTFYILSGLGITVGFHRMLTHKSFETSKPVKALLMMMGCLAVEGSPTSWTSTHIQHHAHSDEEDDPHSPLEGLWHSHIGWMFDHHFDDSVYGTWLRRDPTVVWVNKTWLIWAGMGLLIPFLIGGWTGLLWGGLVRIFLTHHITWSVNSICHTFGNRPFKTSDASRNNWLVGLLAFGEGWHNNHHAFPRSAFHGLRWYQIDFSGYLIRGMEAVGLVWNVQRVKPEQEKRLSAV